MTGEKKNETEELSKWNLVKELNVEIKLTLLKLRF